jgi:hypothetical protein
VRVTYFGGQGYDTLDWIGVEPNGKLLALAGTYSSVDFLPNRGKSDIFVFASSSLDQCTFSIYILFICVVEFLFQQSLPGRLQWADPAMIKLFQE